MENSVQINKEVNVVAYYFQNIGRRLKEFPQKVEFEGKSIVFTGDGSRRLVKKHGHLVRLFDMTDGQDTYRLEFDTQNSNWTLLSSGV
jgi:hypothetical protein